MSQEQSKFLSNAVNSLQRYSFLLASDAKLPNVATIVTGEQIRGSWWKHPLSTTIWDVLNRVDAHPDTLVTKLVSGKVTFVHRALWPAVVGLGVAHQDWQTKPLSEQALSLLYLVQRRGEVRTDRVHLNASTKRMSIGEISRELENKLLVQSRQIHAESGAHAKILRTWDNWARRVGFSQGNFMEPELAKKKLETVLERVNRKFHADGRLPWREI
jgi:hypothetical protein